MYDKDNGGFANLERKGPPTKPPYAVISVEFCDRTTEVREFEGTSWGKLKANGFFSECCQSGRDTSVLRSLPHIVGVTYQITDSPDSTATEQFICRCRRSASGIA